MNKKEKGFTIIELLAVIAVMAAILLIAVPSITGQISSIEESNYNQFKQNVYLATQTYIGSNKKKFSNLKKHKGSSCIKVEDLIKGGWIKSTLKNPKTDDSIDKDSQVLVKNCNGEYKYGYFPNGGCSDTEIQC